MSRWSGIATGIGAAVCGAAIGIAATGGLHIGGAPNEAATGEIVRRYILDHPDIIPQAMDKLQSQQTASAIDANRAAIETPFPGAVGGNPWGDVTLVEYFDYACSFCRATVADIDKLVATDPGVRIVYKELPILSVSSDRAARFSLAAARAGRFADYHRALYGDGQLDDARIDAEAGKLGLAAGAGDAPDIAREIEANMSTARALKLTGTPTFVVGDQLLSGAVGYDALKGAIDKARAARKA